ncbi:MAG: lysis system i-spanin subunit Rz [Pseudomonas sp.]
MNDQAAKLIGYLVLALALIGIGAAGAWIWQANAYTALIAKNETARQADLTLIANAGANQARQAVAQQQDAEQRNAALDLKNTQDKADALLENDALRQQLAGTLAENDQLHSDVDARNRWLRIAGRCPASNPSNGNVSSTAIAPGLGDAAAVELSPEAGQAVFDIRADIIADRAALKALQDYATNVCQGVPPQ